MCWTAGVDPNIDPELAMAIRISLEEAKARNGQRPADAQQEADGH
jgi:hypothetical protein